MADEEIFKPPLAEGALAVSVTSGCSYNRCAFCTMYHGEPFRALPLERTREELAAAKKTYPHVGRVFLEEGDAFALPAARLAEIARLVREFYPAAAISCFASVHNIKAKSHRELAELRACLNEPAAEDADFEEVVSAAEEGIEVEITEDEKSE